MSDLRIFGWDLKILLSYLKSVSSSFSCCKVWCKKNSLSLGPKMPEIWNFFCHIWNQRPQVCLVAKFGAKIKILNMGLKMLDLGSFGLKFENNIIKLN